MAGKHVKKFNRVCAVDAASGNGEFVSSLSGQRAEPESRPSGGGTGKVKEIRCLLGLERRGLVTVVAKFASSPSARGRFVERIGAPPGEPSMSAAIAAATSPVVAICVLFLPAIAVGAVGVPTGTFRARTASNPVISEAGWRSAEAGGWMVFQ